MVIVRDSIAPIAIDAIEMVALFPGIPVFAKTVLDEEVFAVTIFLTEALGTDCVVVVPESVIVYVFVVGTVAIT